MILVAGATGHLGSLVVQELARSGHRVRAVVRPPDPARDLVAAGAELISADLLRPETLDDALRGVQAVVATASAIAPARSGEDDEGLVRGYAQLIDRARATGVERFVLASVPETTLDLPRAHGSGQAGDRGNAGHLRPVLRERADAPVHRGLAGARRQLDPAPR